MMAEFDNEICLNCWSDYKNLKLYSYQETALYFTHDKYGIIAAHWFHYKCWWGISEEISSLIIMPPINKILWMTPALQKCSLLIMASSNKNYVTENLSVKMPYYIRRYICLIKCSMKLLLKAGDKEWEGGLCLFPLYSAWWAEAEVKPRNASRYLNELGGGRQLTREWHRQWLAIMVDLSMACREMTVAWYGEQYFRYSEMPSAIMYIVFKALFSDRSVSMSWWKMMMIFVDN